MPIKQEKKQNITGDAKLFLVAIIMFFLFALMLHPVLFDFRQIPIWHKVLMIVSTVLFFAIIITFIILIEIAVKKSSDIERKKKVQFRLLYIVSLLCAVYFSLGYFNQTIWGTLSIFLVVSFFLLMIFGSYSIVANNFSSLLNKEKIPMIVLSIAIFCCNIAFMLNENRDISDTLLKIAVGIGYVILTAIFIKLTVLSRRSVSSKNIVLFLMICIALPIESFLIGADGGYEQFSYLNPDGHRIHKYYYDKDKAVYPEVLINFIMQTQPRQWARYVRYYGDDAIEKFYMRLERSIAEHGLIYVLKHGVDDMGINIKVCYFKPESDLNESLRYIRVIFWASHVSLRIQSKIIILLI